jgi:hypothetical protein
MNNLAAFTPVKFSLKLIEVLYNETIYTLIANTKYEGDIKNAGDRVRVRTSGKINLSQYTKQMTLVAQELNPTDEDLIIDQQFYFKFVVDDIDKIQNDIDAIAEYAGNAKMDMSELLDSDLLSYARKNVHGKNAIGGNYSAGTVAVAAGTGVVTGSGTTFTAQMVGGYFSADAGVTFQLVTGFNSATSIVVSDLDGSAYSGDAVASGASYVINAATPITLTKANIYQYMVQLGTVMSQQLTPREGRYLVANAELEGLMRQAPQFIPAVESAYAEVIKKGMIGMFANFRIIFSELVDGDNTNGFWFLAGTKEFLAFASQIMKVSVVPSETDPNTFVTTCKGLLVWGRKVFEGNRGRGAVLRAVIDNS